MTNEQSRKLLRLIENRIDVRRYRRFTRCVNQVMSFPVQDYPKSQYNRAARVCRRAKRIQSAARETCPQCGNPQCFFRYKDAPCKRDV